jgi:hypothetical protein
LDADGCIEINSKTAKALNQALDAKNIIYYTSYFYALCEIIVTFQVLLATVFDAAVTSHQNAIQFRVHSRGILLLTHDAGERYDALKLRISRYIEHALGQRVASSITGNANTSYRAHGLALRDL